MERDTSRSSLEFKTLFASVRSARIAVLLDRADPEWQQTCLRIIEFFTQLWGGRHCIIVPTDGTSISQTFWEILEAYDPDYVYTYRNTLKDLKIANPKRYDEIVERETEKFVGAHPTTDRALMRKEIDEQLEGVAVSRFGISSNLQTEVKTRLAPFYLENHIVRQGEVYAGAEPHFPLTVVAKILPDCEHENEVALIQTSLSGIPNLWVGSMAGQVHDAYAETLKKIGINGFPVEFTQENVADLFDLIVQGRVDDNRIQFRAVMAGQEKPAVRDFTANLAFAISMTQLGNYFKIGHQDWLEPVVVVVGESLEDFCLYFCLSRLRQNVAWFHPSWLTVHQRGAERARAEGGSLIGEEYYAYFFAHSVLSLTQYATSERRIVFVSASLDSAQLEQQRNGLDEAAMMEPGKMIAISEIRDNLKALLQFPLLVYERDNISRDTTKQFIGNELAGFFETPKPKHFRKVHPHEHRWITEVFVKGQQYPRHPELGSFIIRDTRLSSHGARSGRNGLAYFCPNLAYFGGDIDTVLVKPKLYLPDALEAVQHIASKAGLRCTVSDKGFFAQEAIRRFGDLEKLANFFRKDSTRSLLDKYLDVSRPGEGIQDEGVFLNSDLRRYLNLQTLDKILGTSEEASKLVDELILIKVFYRGFIFKCRFCRNADWFSVNDVTQEFKCKRCDRQQVYTKEHWKTPLEPGWFYKLDEIVYQGYKQGMLVPILALDYLRRQTKASFLFTNELEFYEGDATKPKLEIDLCCVADGILTIGEAKKEDKLGDNAEADATAAAKYLDLAKRLGARQVVFATQAADWSVRTRNEIQKIFSDHSITGTLLTETQMCSS